MVYESIDRAHKKNIIDIIILGEFNFNMLSDENNKMRVLIQPYSLMQITYERTHITEHSYH